MIVLKINPKNLKKAVQALKSGGVVIYPTDTAYALGGIFSNKRAVNKILKIKGRTDRKFTLIASSARQVEKFFKLNFLQKKLAKKYWPGPLSIVVSEKYAVRVPKNKVARILAQAAGKPLIATSANLTDQKTPYSVKEILRQFLPPHREAVRKLQIIVGAGLVPARNSRNYAGDHEGRPYRGVFSDSLKRGSIHLARRRVAGGQLPDLILSAGPLKKNKPSTIVKVMENKIVVLREGPIKIKNQISKIKM